MLNGEQVNNHIEEDDHADNIVEDDGTNALIHNSFNVIMDAHDDDDCNIPFLPQPINTDCKWNGTISTSPNLLKYYEFDW